MKNIKIFALLTMLCSSTISSFSTNVDSLWIDPNPFDSITIIHFNIVENDTITLQVYNRYGEIIRTYLHNTVLPSGSYSINFNADTLLNGGYIVALALHINSTKTLETTALKGIFGIKDNDIIKPEPILFPNPTNGLLTIPIDGLKIIVVTDLNSRILKNITISTNNISLSDLKSGTYIVTILSDKKQIFSTQKINIIK